MLDLLGDIGEPSERCNSNGCQSGPQNSLHALFWAFRDYCISDTTSNLTSAQNPRIKAIRRAIARNELTPDGFCVAEGPHLVEEARRSSRAIGALFFKERTQALTTGAPVYILPASVFDQLSTTDASQGIIALVRPPEWTIEQTMPTGGLTLVLDGIQDPGNVGAIVRAAEAFGASGTVLLKGTASPFNPKTLRASAGSLFRLPFVYGVDDSAFCNTMERKGITLYAAMPGATATLPATDLRASCAIVIGSEGRGIRPEWSARATGIRIPTQTVESLNAAVAAAVILYEAWRQRTLP